LKGLEVVQLKRGDSLGLENEGDLKKVLRWGIRGNVNPTVTERELKSAQAQKSVIGVRKKPSRTLLGRWPRGFPLLPTTERPFGRKGAAGGMLEGGGYASPAKAQTTPNIAERVAERGLKDHRGISKGRNGTLPSRRKGGEA